MKKHLLTALVSGLLSSQLFAQAAFNTMDSININNINASVLVHGDMWWNPVEQVAHCYFPKNAPTNINFISTLWMSGYDADNKLHVAAQTYRQSGNDYWPGPLDASDTLTYTTSQHWAKIWKVNRSDIQSFLALSTHNSTNTPSAILTWPAKGNANAQGNAGAPLTITQDMAPFVDLNSNGVYEPLLGEYPDVKGDQALWWVFSDNGPSHAETHGRPLGVEIHAMCYAYSRGTILDNIVYYDYSIINKSANTYHNFRIGERDDIDLGWYLDDFIGFDSSHRMGICFNGTNDDGAGGGHPLNSFGSSIPMVGLTMIELPGDVGTNHVPAGNFVYYNNDGTAIGNPLVDSEYNNYLHGKNRVGAKCINYSTSFSPGSGPDTNYVFSGDPSDPSQWSECSSGSLPGDRRFVISSSDFTLNAGGTQHVVMALVTTNPDTANHCLSASFDSIKTIADSAWANYYDPPNAVKNIVKTGSINIYPNPAHDKLFIETKEDPTDECMTIYNSIGQRVNALVQKAGTKEVIDVTHLLPGLYHVIIIRSYDNAVRSATFIKE